MAISEILDVGRQGMAANRQAMQVTSNNIANANTPGYSRQRAQFQSNEQSFVGGVRVGRGVQMKDAIRVHDAFVERQLVEEGKLYGMAKARAELMGRVQGVLANESFNITGLVNNFFNDLRELSLNPEQGALKSAVVLSAKNAANGFREISDTLRQVRSGVDAQIEADVVAVNSLAKELAGLNVAIGQANARGNQLPPHELEDRREVILRELSEKLGIQATTDQFGRKNILIEGVGILVNGDQANELVTMRTEEIGNKAAGSVDIMLKDGSGYHRVSPAIKEGSLAGNLQVRDEVINGALAGLDKAAHRFAQSVNQVHRQGVGSDGLSERDLFDVPAETKDASAFLALSADLEANPDALATGYSPGAQSDNRAILDLLALQEARIMGDGEGDQAVTLNESLNGLVGRIGIQARSDEEVLRNKEAILGQLQNYRESVSGVNLEEEAMNLMQYQTVYNASAKAMKTGLELFDTLLRIVD